MQQDAISKPHEVIKPRYMSFYVTKMQKEQIEAIYVCCLRLRWCEGSMMMMAVALSIIMVWWRLDDACSSMS